MLNAPEPSGVAVRLLNILAWPNCNMQLNGILCCMSMSICACILRLENYRSIGAVRSIDAERGELNTELRTHRVGDWVVLQEPSA